MPDRRRCTRHPPNIPHCPALAYAQNRMTPLKNNWLALYKPVTENLKLDMRMNLKTRKVGWCAPAGWEYESGDGAVQQLVQQLV